jgi:MFS family permease
VTTITPKKALILTVIGNILEYYDFLLFAHIGFIITPIMFPDTSSTASHLLSLLLFGLAFITRPIGGWLLGKCADRRGRKFALTTAMFLSIIPALGLALLPGYAYIGWLAPILFIIFRLWQGIAAGGEYPTAGTYLMEISQHQRGLISGILGGSGNIGSLAGLFVAFICLQENMPDWIWRVAYLLGAIAGIISYRLRYLLLENAPITASPKLQVKTANIFYKRVLIILIGALVAISAYLPFTYTNFYLTKVLHYDVLIGLGATGIAICSYASFCVFFGWLSDRLGHLTTMLYAAAIACPFSILFFYLLTTGSILPAQIGLTMLAASFGAPIHVFINQLFPEQIRAFNVALFLMIGASFGGVVPSVSGYLVKITGQSLIPAFILSFMALMTFLMLKGWQKRFYVTVQENVRIPAN